MDCRDCISYGTECHPDPEDYTLPCPYYKDRRQTEYEEYKDALDFDLYEDERRDNDAR